MSLFEKLTNKNTNSRVISEKLDIKSGESEFDLLQVNTSSSQVTELLSSMREMNQSTKALYEEYDDMVNDDIINSALELYADDSTQLFNELNRIVVVESDDKDMKKDIESFLDSINVDDRIWSWAYELAKYGNFNLRNTSLIERKEEIISNLEYVPKDKSINRSYMSVMNEAKGKKVKVKQRPFKIEEVLDPSTVMDLWYNGERVAFAEEIPEKQNTTRFGYSRLTSSTREVKLYDPRAFIHFSISKSMCKDTIVLDSFESRDRMGRPKRLEYISKRGESMLEGVRLTHRILRLLEDAVIFAKVSRGSFTRIYNIEVGDSTPKKTTEIINRVKSQFHSKSSYNATNGSYSAKLNTRPIADPVFNPVRSGKGNISHEDIGGEVEIHFLEDLEYFRKKKFAGLKVPPAFLGYSDELGGFGQDSILTELDIRYSRTVKRLQNALTEGIEELVKVWWLYNNGKELEDGIFKVRLQNPSSSEESKRLEEIASRVEIVSNITRSITELSEHNEIINTPKLTSLLLKKFIGDSIDLDEVLKEVDKVSQDVDDIISTNKELINQNPMYGILGPDAFNINPDMGTDINIDSNDSTAKDKGFNK